MGLTFQKGTDSEQEITVDTVLISAMWGSAAVYAGKTARFEVRTALAGQGAPVRIEGVTQSGRRFGRIEGALYDNLFTGRLEIPGDMSLTDRVHFTAELPKHGVTGESEPVPVRQTPSVINLRWSESEVCREDLLTMTADVSGVQNLSEVTIGIYEYDADGAHDRVTQLPATVKDDRIEAQFEFEYHGNVDEIPTEAEMQQVGRHYSPPQFFFTVTVGDTEFGRDQDSGLVTFQERHRIAMRDEEGSQAAERDFRAELPDGTQEEGTLDEEGQSRLSSVAPGPVSVTLTDGPEEEEMIQG